MEGRQQLVVVKHALLRAIAQSGMCDSICKHPTPEDPHRWNKI